MKKIIISHNVITWSYSYQAGAITKYIVQKTKEPVFKFTF